MNNYSKQLLSAAVLLASLVQAPLTLAETDEGVTPSPAETNTIVSPTNPVSIQLSYPTATIKYQRTIGQEQTTIRHAVWSDENGQDDIRWYEAGQEETTIHLTHHKGYGTYHVHTYVFTDTGAVAVGSSQFILDKPIPTIEISFVEKGVLNILISNVEPTTTEVIIPIWTEKNGQDDIKWYTAIRQSDGRYTVQVPLKNHHFQTGNYIIHAYHRTSSQSNLVALAGQTLTVTASDIPNLTKPNFAITQLNQTDGRYTVTVSETATTKSIQKVDVATWSTSNQSNIKWRSTTSSTNGVYTIPVDFKEHQAIAGRYHNHAYVTYTDGSRVGYAIDPVNLTTARLPLSIHTQFATNGTFNLTISDITSKETIRYAVWSDENGQDDLRWYSATHSGNQTANGVISLANHKGTGTYHLHVYQGNRGFPQTFQVTSTQKSSYPKTPNTYPVGQCTWGAKELAPWVPNYWGNAGQWAASARKAGFSTGTTPQVGAVICWTDGGYGHVAVVTEVASPTRIKAKEANYAGNTSINDYRGWFDPINHYTPGAVTYIYPR